jgi:hypothetical protein
VATGRPKYAAVCGPACTGAQRQWSGGRSGALDRRDVELELDLLRHQHAAGLEGGAPAQTPALAVDGDRPSKPTRVLPTSPGSAGTTTAAGRRSALPGVADRGRQAVAGGANTMPNRASVRRSLTGADSCSRCAPSKACASGSLPSVQTAPRLREVPDPIRTSQSRSCLLRMAFSIYTRSTRSRRSGGSVQDGTMSDERFRY